MSPETLQARLVARIGRLTIDLALDTGPGSLVVVGPNGAGKTTLLALLLGVLSAEQAEIRIGDAVLANTATGVSVPLEGRRLGYVPQDYALFPHLTVRENVLFAVRSASPKLTPGASSERVERLLSDLKLVEQASRRPSTLSGGERQRLALARALSVEPRALLLDEPLAALDVHARGEVREFLAGYLGRVALPTIVVTHDPEDARRLGHRILVLESGRITQLGSWDDLVKRPASPFVQRFVAGPR
jgi:molybdate transport system ATP-binding protein